MTKHTPWPWHVQKSDDPKAGLLIKPIPGDVVAECDPLPEMAANAFLIAAAPELLEALHKIDSNAAESAEWIRRVARAAIDKAEGMQ